MEERGKAANTPITVRKCLLVLFLILTIAQMGSIYYMSSKNSDESSVISAAVSAIIRSFTVHDFNALKAEEKDELVSTIDPTLREIAHVTEYMLLGILLSLDAYFITLLKTKEDKAKAFVRLVLLPLLAGLLYALSDEIHQIFVAGRAFELMDLLLDGAGAFIGCLLIFLLFRKRFHRELTDRFRTTMPNEGEGEQTC